MTLRLDLPPIVESKIRERAAQIGQSPNEYAATILVEAVSSPTADGLLAPARKQIAESGIDDAELDHFLYDLREKVWQEKGSRDIAPKTSA